MDGTVDGNIVGGLDGAIDGVLDGAVEGLIDGLLELDTVVVLLGISMRQKMIVSRLVRRKLMPWWNRR